MELSFNGGITKIVQRSHAEIYLHKITCSSTTLLDIVQLYGKLAIVYTMYNSVCA